ncbi:MAG: hypothetical protein ACK56F_11180, partial [bacterium]
DDTTGLDSDSDLNSLMARASSELTKMAHWFQANKMSLNTSKTKYIIFHAPGKKVNSDIASIYLLKHAQHPARPQQGHHC